MKTELLNKPARHLRIDSSGLLLMCLTFMLGVGAYVLTKPSLPQSAHVNYLIVDLDYRVFGCILCLLLVQLTAFSVIGSVIIPVLDFIFGFFVSVSLATIIPADKLNVIFIAKVFSLVFVFIFSALALSCSFRCLGKEIIRQNSKRKKVQGGIG